MTYDLETLENIAWGNWMRFAHNQRVQYGVSLNLPSGIAPSIEENEEGRITATFFNSTDILQVFVWNERKKSFEYSEELTLQAKQIE
jgi:hypothetical protein